MNIPRALCIATLVPWLAACSTTTPAPPAGERAHIMCTQDVQQCPDGRFVGRTPPSCVFVCAAGPAPAAR